MYAVFIIRLAPLLNVDGMIRALHAKGNYYFSISVRLPADGTEKRDYSCRR